MTKNLIVFLFSLLLFSCSNPSESDKIAADSIAVVKDSSVAMEEQTGQPSLDNFKALDSSFSFTDAVFEYGESSLLDECKFDFGCDCCSSKIIFYNDSSYYFIDYCMADLSVTQGNFSINENKIELISDGICINKEYDDSKAYNPLVDEFTLRDTITRPYIVTFGLKSCEGRVAFMHEVEGATLVGLLIKEDVSKS